MCAPCVEAVRASVRSLPLPFDTPMANLLLAPVMRFLGRLSYPKLMLAFAALFVVDMVVIDPIPFIDEILFGLGTLLLANWKKRKAPPASGTPPIDGEARRL